MRPYALAMIPSKRFLFLLVVLLIFGSTFLLGGCSDESASTTNRSDGALTPIPFPTPTFLPATSTPTFTPPPSFTPIPQVQAIFCDPNLRSVWRQAIQETLQSQSAMCVDVTDNANLIIKIQPLNVAGANILARRFYAVVVPFASVRDDVSLAELQARWLGAGGALVVSEEAAGPLTAIFGPGEPQVVAAADMAAELSVQDGALGILPFHLLDPSFKVLTVDGVSVLDKKITPQTYPLAIAITLTGLGSDQIAGALSNAIQPLTNRDTKHLTTLIMTGVTAMSRGTAAKMEQKGYLYPAMIISDTLSAADITHVSNEVPFIEGCEVNNTYMNLVLCSDYPYLRTLEAIGVDIVGLSGNHVNDFGREGARESLQFYKDNHIPVYGSGLNEEEACKPLMWEANGNTYAFLAALAWWPEDAWATDTEPGACYYWRNRSHIIDMIHQLSHQVDIVSVELQYEETYNPWPTRDQVEEFRALHNAGADIVTGVQSHVPQAAEPYGLQDTGGPAIILYGLGNLFFDQMQSWETRTGLIARHTIYQGRLLSTELLTTVLDDFAQPRWASPEERAEILRSIFEAAPPRDDLPNNPLPTPATSGATKVPTSLPSTPEAKSSKPPFGDTAPPVVHPQPTPPPTGVAVLSWPQHQASSEPHFYLARPTGADANRMEDLGYAFGSTANGRYRVHHGIDIANPVGTPLLAPADGVVVYAGPDDDSHRYGPYADFYGNVVVFKLDQSWMERAVYVLYGHLQQIQVSDGERVVRGEQVGSTGMTGIAIGPHVHVEVRLDTPVNYDAVYNTALWMQPFAGYGVIAGQVVTPDGRAWNDVKLHAYRLSDDGAHLYRVFNSYALDEGLRPDPQLAENAVLGSVPAGEYEIVLKLNDATYRQKLYLAPTQVAWFQFVIP